MGAVKQWELEKLDRGGFDTWLEFAEYLDQSSFRKFPYGRVLSTECGANR